MKQFEEIKTLIADLETQLEKSQKGNASAGLRVRKACQRIKVLAQEIRLGTIQKKTEQP